MELKEQLQEISLDDFLVLDFNKVRDIGNSESELSEKDAEELIKSLTELYTSYTYLSQQLLSFYNEFEVLHEEYYDTLVKLVEVFNKLFKINNDVFSIILFYDNNNGVAVFNTGLSIENDKPLLKDVHYDKEDKKVKIKYLKTKWQNGLPTA